MDAAQKIIELAEEANIPGLSVITLDPKGDTTLTHHGRKRSDQPALIDDQTIYTLRPDVWETPEESSKQKFIHFGLHRFPTKSLLVMQALEKGLLSLEDAIVSLYQNHPKFSDYTHKSNWNEGVRKVTLKQYLDDDRLKDYSYFSYGFEVFGKPEKGFGFVDILAKKMGYEGAALALKELIFDPAGVSLPSVETYDLKHHAIPHKRHKGHYDPLWGYRFDKRFNFSIQNIAKFYAHHIPKVLDLYRKETDHLIYQRSYEDIESERWLGWRIYFHEGRKLMVFDNHIFVEVATGKTVIFITNVNVTGPTYNRFSRRVLDLLLLKMGW